MCEVGALAAKAEENKRDKYSHLDALFLFVPVAVETCGAFWARGWRVFQGVGAAGEEGDQRG